MLSWEASNTCPVPGSRKQKLPEAAAQRVAFWQGGGTGA